MPLEHPDQNTTATGPDRSIDLLELLSLFVVEWRTLLLVLLISFTLGVIGIYAITPLFEASASILPQSKEDSGNLAAIFSGRSPGDVFIGLLESRSVADEVVDKADLLNLYQTRSRETARDRLAAHSVFAVGKDTLVAIKVRDKNAQDAMRITNAYLDSLEDQRKLMLRREADLHNSFFQQQLNQEADALSQAEEELQKVEENTGLVQPEAQTNIGINAIAGIRQQIDVLQVQLASVRLGASEENPQVKSLRAQIAQLEAQERTLQSANTPTGAGAAATARQMPRLNLEYSRKLRALKYHETVFTSISNQYEAARLLEGYSGTPFVVVDRAIVPEHKAWPPRRMLILLAFAFSAIVALAYVGVSLIWADLKRDPVNSKHIATIRSSLRLRR